MEKLNTLEAIETQVKQEFDLTLPAHLVSEEQFQRTLCRERKRSERSRKQLLLMLISPKKNGAARTSKQLETLSRVLCGTVRETDVVGWFEADSVLGAILTELGTTDGSVAAKIVEDKIRARLNEVLEPSQLSELQISFHTFPEDRPGNGSKRLGAPVLYPDLFETARKKKLALLAKRVMDVVGAGCALFLFSPLFLVFAALIKLTSKGPVFFRQQRVGQYGETFQFLKFRSMYVSTNSALHKEYVKNFIAGNAASSKAGDKQPVYKITHDPRVTWVGKFMRRTSIDELPQFWNVLKGQMSLVGPRPPIPYEIDAYDIWHLRRVLEVKPGITGLWQVYGRSRTTFDEMVRLDLKYSRTWSPLLDLKILLQTPRAVFSGEGAY